MKLKNKGQVHPSPPPSSSSGEDSLSILKLLPAAILTLASVLSLDDREVLAYMITRSLTTNSHSALISQDIPSKRNSAKKPPPSAAAKLAPRGGALPHKSPFFDCDCFNCYTSYWFRWDSSPNRELIHQVIEAFEEHLSNGEVEKPSKKHSRSKKRDNNGKSATPVSDDTPVLDSSSPADKAPVSVDDVTTTEKDVDEHLADVSEMTEIPSTASATSSSHKGLARKILPDVLGLFNSRLWGLWNPNM